MEMKEQAEAMIDFRPITWRDRALYERYFSSGETRGCEFSFANLYLWGRQNLCEYHGQLLLFSHGRILWLWMSDCAGITMRKSV